MVGQGAELRCDHCAIANVLGRYTYVVDHVLEGAVPELEELFSDNATWNIQPAPEDSILPVRGARAIAELIIGRRDRSNRTSRRRHLNSNLLIDVCDDTNAVVRSQLTMVRLDSSGPTVTGTGRYDDHLTRMADGRWRFARRELFMDYYFAKPGHFGGLAPWNATESRPAADGE